jgi:hypothetical protein
VEGVAAIVRTNLLVGWGAIGAGVLSGAIIGLFFHREDWMGGYASFRRRLTRLGHISFFGMGLLNVLFAVSLVHLPASAVYARSASMALVAAAVTMPLCCFLTAWRTPWRHLFPVPVVATIAAVGLLLAGWLTP